MATADGKGVPMRRPLEERVRRGPRRGKGEKANKKQMAYVGAVYTIDRFRRTADEVVDELARKERAADRPAPQHKQVWAEMTRVLEGESCTGRERLFVEMAIACHERDPTAQEDAGLPDGWRGGLVGRAARVAAAGRGHPGSVPRAGAAVAGGPRVSPRREPRGRAVRQRTTCGCCWRARWAT